MFGVPFFFGCALLCSTSADTADVLTIPEAISLEELEQYGLDNWIKEVLLVQPYPEVIAPKDAVHLYITHTGTSSYSFHVKGEETLVNGTTVCRQKVYHNELVSDTEAVFQSDDDFLVALFSDEPSLYIAAVRCMHFDQEEGNSTCPLSQSFVHLFATSDNMDIDKAAVLDKLGIEWDTEGLSFYSSTSVPSACQY